MPQSDPSAALQRLRSLCDAATPGPLREGINGNLRAYGPDNTEHAGLVAQFYRRADLTAYVETHNALSALIEFAEAAPKYMQHNAFCEKFCLWEESSEPYQCTCGLDALRQRLAEGLR